jgi:hypothetical protein
LHADIKIFNASFDFAVFAALSAHSSKSVGAKGFQPSVATALLACIVMPWSGYAVLHLAGYDTEATPSDTHPIACNYILRII